MNSPTNNFGYIHEARYMPRQNPSSNIYLVKNPVLMSHPTLNNHTASYGTIPHVQTTPKIAQNRIKFSEESKLSTRNTPSKRIEQKYFPAQPRYSDISQCSIRQILQTTHHDQIKNKLITINDKINTIMTKLNNHEQKIKQLENKQENIEKQKQQDEILQNMIRKIVERQINQAQQHFMVQHRLMNSDIQTLKLEIKCFVNKSQLKDIAEKNQVNEKNVKILIKQLEERVHGESEKVSERRKKDFELFEKQIEQMRAKLMQLVFQQQNRESSHQLCLLKSLSFKILHEMKVYNQDQLQWIDLGSGQTIYGLDEEGYLLDSQSKYITTPTGSLIKLEQTHIQILKQHGLTK